MHKTTHQESMPNLQQTKPDFHIGQGNVVCIHANASLTEAARIMCEHHIGDLVVTERGEGIAKPVGMITDRDIAIKTVAKGFDPESVKVSEVMTTSVATAHADESIFSMVDTMKECGVSRLPLVDDSGALCGIVTAKNLFQTLTACLDNLARISEQQNENEKTLEH